MYFDLPSNDDENSRFERLRDNFIWFYSNYNSLKKDFKNQYVAIKNRKNIDHDANLEILIKRLNLKNYEESIAIEFVDN